MDNFGESLRHEREDSGLSVEAVSERIGADQNWLLALERNDFEALPDNETVMMDTLRAYAECLGVEADLMIGHYFREREKCLQKLEQAITAQVPLEISPSAVHPGVDRPSRLPRPLVVSGILVAVVALGAWWIWSGDGAQTVTPGPLVTPPVAAPEPAAAPARVESLPVPLAAQPTVVEPSPVVTPTEIQPTQKENLGSGPGISKYGVGTAVEDRQLVGEGSRFRKGTQVWFWTRVDSGNSGDKIKHVWLHEGAEVATVPLELGGSSWRTYSSKMLHLAGGWAVEARDEVGQVLARTEFVCID